MNEQAQDSGRDHGRSVDGAEAWRAVRSRDRSRDGSLYYGVVTTGVYCKPSCPSRRPKRRNARFFTTRDDAEAAGFRACLRCRPDRDTGTVTEYCIRKAVAYIHEHAAERITLATLGRHVGLSPTYLQRKFKAWVGVSPREYQRALRVERMKGDLKDGGRVGDAIYGAGFASSRGAYEAAANGMGMTPGEYRRGASGLTVSYALSDSPFGRMLVASTPKGVCSVLLGEHDEALEKELRAEFPRARLARDQERLLPMLESIQAHVRGDQAGLALPLDLHGTAFQMKVWNALRAIPRGETRSYSEVAAELGAPSAARAVAAACAANRAAIAVPCHRVVGKDGSPSGYRWGPERKRTLLALECTAS